MNNSNLVVRANKYRLYPDAIQKSLLFNITSVTRFAYNKGLELVKSSYFGEYVPKGKTDSVPKIPSQTELINLGTKIKRDYPFIKAPNDYIQDSLNNLYLGLNEFRKGSRGYPKFKSRKRDKSSITTKAGSRIRLDDNYIIIPRYKSSPFSPRIHKIKFKKHKTNYEILKITNMSITKDNLDRYWVTITGYCEPNVTHNNSRTQVGVDFGLKDLLIASDGTKISNLRFTNKYQMKLSILQRRLSRKKLKSKNRNKARIKVAKCHDKIKNSRNYNNHVISRALINIYDFIALESLDIKSMMKNRQLSKSIQDVSWYQLLNNLKYKSSENQTTIVQVNKYFPSSKRCSKCHSIKSDLELKDRTYKCSNCGLVIDRDLNAARNLLEEGLRLVIKKNKSHY